ncbi:MAG TPA: alpha/beta hydrolase [Deltaproteobacteria bacterium]|nr:alpha/beta hydrolase [Deltaproteobacteria bacterium]HQB39790.1 alpha/beta hydrolase [Deltaproteobacteria bacterium]
MIRRLLRIVVLAYLGYGALMFFMQRQMIYPGTSLVRQPSVKLPVRSEQLLLQLPGGAVSTRFIPASGAGRRHPAVIVCHGNMELADDMATEMLKLHRLGIGVLLLEYPGYGGQPGRPSEPALARAAVAAYDALAKRNDVDPARIIAFGRSLGGGVACALARQRPVSALVLVSTFASLRPFAHGHMLPGFLLRDVYDNQQVLGSFGGPVLIVHGRQDRVVPFWHAERLLSAARNATFKAMDGDHNDIISARQFWPAVQSFLVRQQLVGIVAKGI